jgi:hypothetical protein
MKIILSPIASDRTTTISINGLELTIDGEIIDLSVIPEGGVAEPDQDSPFVGNVTRQEATVQYHYDSKNADSNQSTNWDDYTFEVTSGEVPCPIVWKPEPDVIDIEKDKTNEVEDV